MKVENIQKNQSKDNRPWTSQILPRAKAQRPMAWLLVGGWRGKLTQKRQWPLARRIKSNLKATVST